MRRAALSAVIAAGALAAPAAARAQSHPDLTGVWVLASKPMTSAQGYPDLPLTEAGRRKVGAYRALVDPLGENPGMYCVVHGMPEMMMGGGGYPIEVLQKPDQVTIISEALNEMRRVFLGDRVAADTDLFPTRQGYSKGHWEGGALVVETDHMQELADSRFPHSAAATVTERLHLQHDPDGTPRLIDDTVVRDPEWLSEDLQYRLEWTPSPTGWILPYSCTETTWLDHLDELAAGAGQSAGGE